MWTRLFAYLVFVACTLPAQAVEPLNRFNVVLLQPDDVLQARVVDVSDVAVYVKAVEAAASEAVKAQPDQVPIGGFIVLAVKPGEKSNAWLDFRPELKPTLVTRMLDAVKAVKPFPVRGGVVVFALKVGLWGGREPKIVAPAPAEWRTAAERAGGPPEVGALVDMLWPDEGVAATSPLPSASGVAPAAPAASTTGP